MYLYCYDCGNIFSEETARTKLAEEGYGLKEVYGCPDCGSTYVSEAEQCAICGEPMIPDRYDSCEDCRVKLGAAWQRFVEDVMGIRMEHGEILSADYLDCQDAAVEYLEDVGVTI